MSSAVGAFATVPQPATGAVRAAAVVKKAAAVSASSQLTLAARKTLLSHWNGSNKAQLQADLDAGKSGAFDQHLLDYMRNRTGQTFYWKTSDVSGIASFINANISSRSAFIARADAVLQHKFPQQANSSTFTVTLSTPINWLAPPASQASNPEFIHSLNRMGFWGDLAVSAVLTNNTAYTGELVSQLAGWSSQVGAPSTKNDPPWQVLDTALRADAWTNAYAMLVGTSGWTKEANTLFLSKLYDTGKYLASGPEIYAATSNRRIFQGKGLLEIAQLVPEFVGTGGKTGWKASARTMIFTGMDAQIYADGGHVEESPGYAAAILDDLLEAYHLDQRKGEAGNWPANQVTRLHNAATSYVQLLSPDGTQPALSDTYRSTAGTFFTKAREVLASTDFPAAKPRVRDVFLFGTSASGSILGAPAYPALGDRGTTYGLPQSGYYVMRSGADAGARQLIFDAGPTGGIHGHFDLLNFELSAYGKPLISDPGLYKYDTSSNRSYVVSTRSHNTINVDGKNHAALEGAGNSNIVVDQWTQAAGYTQVTAHHLGYAGLAGSPVVGRSVWFNNDNTAVIVDWAEASSVHAYGVGFNLPGTSTTVSGVQPDGSFYTKNSSGNVKVIPILQAGQAVNRVTSFVSNNPPPNESDPAYHFNVSGTGKFQCFVTVVTTYGGSTAPGIAASIVSGAPQKGQPVVVRVNGQDVTFTPPDISRPPANVNSGTGGPNGLAWDGQGHLHLAYYDRNTRNLKYTVRDAAGNWSVVGTIDPGTDCGTFVSLAVDGKGNPGVAYYDGANTALKYAKLTDGAWKTETIVSSGAVGQYPSLVFSRTDGPMISFYNRTKADLQLAVADHLTWTVSTIESKGDVGRWSSITLDPNRPTASKVAVAYEDTTHGTHKYATPFQTGWTMQTIDAGTTGAGGYTSLAWTTTTNARGRRMPAVSYYDAANSAVKYATADDPYAGMWSAQTVASKGKQGLYTNLFFDGGGKPNVFFFNKTGNSAWRAKKGATGWTLAKLAPGGREMHVARRGNGAIAYTNVDTSVPILKVNFLSS